LTSKHKDSGTLHPAPEGINIPCLLRLNRRSAGSGDPSSAGRVADIFFVWKCGYNKPPLTRLTYSIHAIPRGLRLVSSHRARHEDPTRYIAPQHL
jgi:hypothetical protein